MKVSKRRLYGVVFVGAVLAALVMGVYLFWQRQTPKSAEAQSNGISTTSLNPTKPHSMRQFIVPANEMWIDTGVDTTGKVVTIRYIAGTWSNGGPKDQMLWSDATGGGSWPNLIVPGVPIRALVGKTDEGNFFVGNFHEIRDAHGHLKLSMNDTAGTFDDNQGSLTVSITVE